MRKKVSKKKGNRGGAIFFFFGATARVPTTPTTAIVLLFFFVCFDELKQNNTHQPRVRALFLGRPSLEDPRGASSHSLFFSLQKEKEEERETGERKLEEEEEASSKKTHHRSDCVFSFFADRFSARFPFFFFGFRSARSCS